MDYEISLTGQIYLQGKQVRSIAEYALGKMVAAISGEINLYCIDFEKQEPSKVIKIRE